MILLILLLGACKFGAATKVEGDDSAHEDTDGGGDSGEDSGEDSGDDSGEDTDTGQEVDPEDLDDDGDGYTENQGDCDDGDPTVAPDTEDACNGEDDDCDDEVDEDAVSDDANEPNDDSDTDLGTLEDEVVVSASGILHNAGDVDRFGFDFEDGSFSIFELSVTLSGIPTGAEYRMTLDYLDGSTEIGQESGGDDLEIVLEDTLASEDGGSYRVTVDALSGADCGRRYLVSLELNE